MTAPLDYHEVLFTAAESSRIYWALVEELFACKSRLIEDAPASKRMSAAMIAGWTAGLSGIGRQRTTTEGIEKFSPTVAMLAGMLHRVPHGMLPDHALVTLYRDGTDLIDWHIDSETQVGPHAGDAFVATFSFGEPRTILFQAFDEAWTESVQPEQGSLYIMKRNCQRTHRHAVPKSDTDRARLSVTFFCNQNDEPKDLWWTVSRIDAGKAWPIASMPPKEAALAYMEHREQNHTIVLFGPFGIIEEPKDLAETLLALGHEVPDCLTHLLPANRDSEGVPQ